MGAAGGSLPWPYIDTLFDFTEVIQAPISNLAGKGKSVAIIGAGAAGMCAAYELWNAGIVPVVYEQSNRIGGRAWSQPFHNGSYPATAFAELGSMRVPPSQETFNAYAKRFGMQVAPGGFPDPGKVQTRLYFQNQRYDWAPNTPPPGLFNQLSNDFNDWIGPMVQSIQVPLEEGNYSQCVKVWQALIDKYKDTSFYEALVEGIPSWTTEDLIAFGALGVGSGGFGPLYEINMVEMLRIIALGWEDNQQLYLSGMQALPMAFYTTPPPFQTTSLQQQGAVVFNTTVTGIEWDPQNRRPVLMFGSSSARPFDAVIVATTTRSMSFMGLTLPTSGGQQMISGDAQDGIRDLHMTASSKLFIRTQTKFWQNQGGTFPANIQTDELPRGIYALDYGPNQPNGVILVSYTWEDDSQRLQAVDPLTRFTQLLPSIQKAAPEWYPYLKNPMNGEILSVDWQNEVGYYGAFKLDYPGTEPQCQASYFQYQSCLSSATDTGVYLAGDGVSWSGGWTEGALQTALNAVTAVARRFGGSLASYNCLMQEARLYNYDTGPSVIPEVPAHLGRRKK